jgi:hypothetical protein
VAWTFVLTDRAGNPLGELRDATARSIRFPLNKTPTFSFTVQTDNPFSSLFLTDDKVLVKAYDDSAGVKTLRFFGPVVGHDKARNSSGGSISVTAAGAQWRLGTGGQSGRYIGKSNTGATFGTTALATLDRGEIMGRIIDALNTGESTNIFTTAGDTGIRRGTITASAATYISDWRYKLASEALADLSGTLDGPDWQVRPTEPTTDGTGLQIGLLDVAPAFGSLQQNVAFAFGTAPYNVAEWHDVGDSSSLANFAINLPSGFPDNATSAPVTSSDATAIADRGLYETVVSADLQTDTLRTTLVQEHVRVRKTPKRVIAFTPVAESSTAPIEERRVPRLFSDYIVGDVVVFRAVERFSVTDTAGTVIGQQEVPTVDLLMRVFVAQVDLDDAGVATTSLALQVDG